MLFRFESLCKCSKQIFSSQDSRFFIINALKFTVVPIISAMIVFYSLWTILEMNFNFYVANGFTEDTDVFYDLIFKNVNEYLVYFSIMLISIFMLGLFVSFLALRAFDHIEGHTHDIRDNIDHELKVSLMNRKKLIYQVSRLFFHYIQFQVKYGEKPKVDLPNQISNLKSPPVDRLFLIQYTVIAITICIGSNILFFDFTHELFQEIISGGLDLLPNNKVVSSFLDAQKTLFYNIFAVGVITHIIAYVLVAKQMIKTVDGVSFGFARDMVGVLQGKHYIRLTPRRSDPGQSFALIINEVLEDIFPLSNYKAKSFDEAIDDTISKIEEEHPPLFNKMHELSELNEPDIHPQDKTLEQPGSKVISMLLRGELLDSVLKENQNSSISHTDLSIKKKGNSKFT